MSGDWEEYLIYNKSNEPLVSLRFGVSPPCGDGTPIAVRKIVISKLFESGLSQCYFSKDDSSIHPDYYSTGLTDTEYNVLNNAGLIEKIKSKVPDFSTELMSKSNYTLYAKSYATWSPKCNK